MEIELIIWPAEWEWIVEWTGRIGSLHYGSFAALSERAKVLAQRTRCSKWVTKHALRWQLFLDEQSKDHPDWSVTHCKERGLFLPECLFHNMAVMKIREMQWHLQRWPYSHQSMTAEKTFPVYLSVKNLLGSANEEILKLGKDVYCEWYQVGTSILPCWHQDQLVGDLLRELDQWMMRASFHITTGSDHTLSRDRTCFWACSQPWAWSPLEETSRKEGTSAPLHHRHNHMQANWSPSTDSIGNWECLHASSSDEGHPSLGDQLLSEGHPQSTRYVSPSASPSQYEDEWLHSSFSNLDLEPQQQGLLRCTPLIDQLLNPDVM